MYFKNISASELSKYIEDDSYLILDVRSYREYQVQHVKTAIWVEKKDLVLNPKKYLYKKKIIVYCARGGESVRVASRLSEMGYFVMNVIGGFVQINQVKNILC